MRLRVGTSGFSYKEWKGSFYPEDLPASKMLAFYAERFSSVEINNTFYRMPKAEMLTGWRDEVPKDFLFVLKAPQRITHIKRLKDPAESLPFFFNVASALGTQLGPSLFQLPPNMKKDTERLGAFLEALPKDAQAAFEFRHESWFDDEVYELLKKHGAALCMAEADELACPWVASAPFGYLRLRKTEYSDAELAAWAKRAKAEKWNTCFVFLKHEDAGTGPRYAATFEKAFKAGA